MRFLIVGYLYQDYLESLYFHHPEYRQLSYQDAWKVLTGESADVTGAYSSSLQLLGHEAQEVIANDELLQKKWALENGLGGYKQDAWRNDLSSSSKRLGRRVLKSTGSLGREFLALVRKPLRKMADPWLYEILAAQVEKIRPDVFLTLNIVEFDYAFLQQIKPFVRLIVGQHASPMPKDVPYCCYDLIVSSLPHYIDFFRRQGINSEYFRLGFNASSLNKLQRIPNSPAVVHVGSYGTVHNERNELLEAVAEQVRVDFWGIGIENLAKDSPILKNYHGEAWGTGRNNILYSSRIALTKHISSVASQYANNLTLYEATGVGTMLITDMKHNLDSLFEVGREVLAYRDAQECVDLIEYYLAHEAERDAIAAAGQRRTLREHTYYHRMRELVEIVKRYIA